MKKILNLTKITIGILIIIEVLLRIAGFSSGKFAFLLEGDKGLYPKNKVLKMKFGKIPYIIKTNSYGFRGEEISLKKPPGVYRIACIGDSVTDGFFLKNNETYPYKLACFLNKHLNKKVQVLNIARGGGGIRKELHFLKNVALKFKPDMVILIFVTNDIYELSIDTLWTAYYGNKPQTGWIYFVKKGVIHILQTATGEFLYYLYSKLKKMFTKTECLSTEFAQVPVPLKITKKFVKENADKFDKVFGYADGKILKNKFSLKVKQLVSRYIKKLAEFKRKCDENGIKMVFIYFPAYSQLVYKNKGKKIRKILKKACLDLNISFLDTTEYFRKKMFKDAVNLHFVPKDFHLNPAGTAYLASVVGNFILKTQMILK